MKTIKIFSLKIFVLIIIIAAAQANAFPIILCNGAGGGYGEPSGGEGLVCDSSSIENYIKIGAGHYLEAYSSILSFFNRVELAGENNRDFYQWQLILYKAITRVNQAEADYDLLIREAEATPYNETVLLKLKNFDYARSRVTFGLKIEIFQEVESYLKAGNITGVFKRIRASLKEIHYRLETIHAELTQNKMPALVSLWDLNELCSSTLLFGQYVSRVFYALP
jgi:hypothetical protein